MNSNRYSKRIVTGLMLLPVMLSAQNFNNSYNFSSPYQRSVHTCAYENAGGQIVEGGTIDNPFMPAEKVMEIGWLNAGTGLVAPAPYYYGVPGFDNEAVDLIPSTTNPNFVIAVSNLTEISNGNTRVVVFKTNSAGTILWSIVLGNPDIVGFRAKAIRADGLGNYYVLGNKLGSAGPEIYLARITDFGVVNWERQYRQSNTNLSFDAIDLLYDVFFSRIVLVADRRTPFFANGAVVISVNPATGNAVTAAQVNNIAGTRDFNVRDMDTVNGRYVVVGQINTPAKTAFLFQYMPGLTPVVPFSQTYVASAPDDTIIFTGVKSSLIGGDIFVSCDYAVAGAANYSPAIERLNFNGIPLAGYYFNVPDYDRSSGLIAVGGFRDFVVKGSTFSGFVGTPLLSMVSTTSTPFMPPNSICPDTMPLFTNDTARQRPVTIITDTIVDHDTIQLKSDTINGDIFDCFMNSIGSFRLAPTGINASIKDRSIEIYPNPSSGLFTLDLGETPLSTYEIAEVYDMTGKLIFTLRVNNRVQNIDLSGQLPGIYLLRLKSSDGHVRENGKLLIR